MEIFLGCGAFFCLVEFLLYRRRERKLKELTLRSEEHTSELQSH